MPVRFNPVGLLCAQIGLGVLMLLPLFAVEVSRTGLPQWQDHLFWILLYVGLFPSVLAHICWINGVERGGANLSGILYNLIPVFAIALAIPMLGEVPDLYHFVGVALIFAGIYFAVFRQYSHFPSARTGTDE
jgi:drug/metabolite transporter (DMT)-like permease